jgi:hypothetical protein
VRVRLRELTPPGTGAISVLEVSGPAALERLSRQFPGKRLSPGRVVLLRLACGGEELDEALVWCESDVRAEVHVHGSPPLVKRLLAEFARAGFDTELPAGPRTLEERALERVPLAPTAAGARMLLDQAEGALRREVLRLLDLPFEERKAGLSLLALRARRARTLLEGARVVLAGVVNAGKSTLFNALVGSERALVTPEAGTTRDLVIERAHLGHWPVWLCDTAGERALEPQESGARVEAAGQELGRRARGAADLVLWLVPADAASGPAAPAGALVVVTRADLVAFAPTSSRSTTPRALAGVRDPRAFRARQAIRQDLRAWSHLCPGLISASLFYEPSTRTRLSFESAMLRLGGGVLTAADMKSTPRPRKGESLADTVRVVGGSYADVIVLRHASEGAARLAAQYSPIPVVNAGDGSHEHPTQTLCDLYNLWLERGRIDGIHVVLAGDLRYSRTIHSFVYALARFGANIVCTPQPGFELPGYVMQRLREEFGVEPVRADVSRLGELAASATRCT